MKKTILIVDDEEMVVDITKRKLTQDGFLIIGVHNGEEALKVLQQGPVDLIILDIEMPKMNGYIFLSERKKIPGGDKAPVIVLTAYDSMEPIFRRNGAVEYLTKPIRFQELLDKIYGIVGGSNEHCKEP
ncbi:MAG: response regulator [Candidatus Omnitrophica bacterium]|nr:response regulator [Candidatus Omnitrophota bacterium]